jgi:DNA-binding NarL/FixJ family response regulator
VNKITTVLVADDQVLVRAGVEALVAGLPGFACIGSAGDGPGCLRRLLEAEPDILLLDLGMPGNEGLSVAREVRRRHPAVRIVILTARADAALAREALALGVSGYVSKEFVLDELALALRGAIAGRTYVSPDVALAAAPAQPAAALSPRQREVLCGIARGRSNKVLARELGLSVKTVEYHRAELIARLDLHDVASLTRYAVEHGLVD